MNDQADVFGQKIKSVMAAHPGVAPHRDIDIPLGPLQALADALEQALCVPGLIFFVDASYGLGVVSVIALIGSSNLQVWHLTAHCANYPTPSAHFKHKLLEVTVFGSLTCTNAEKPDPLGRTLRVECDDLTGLADYLMQYVDDAKFGAEMIALRKIALGASVREHTAAMRKVAPRRAEKPDEGDKRAPQVKQAIDLGQGDPRMHALTRLREAVEEAIVEVPSAAALLDQSLANLRDALLDQSLANLRDAINIAKIVDADLYSWEAAQNVLWSIEHTIEYKKRFDGHVKEALEEFEQVGKGPR